MEPTLPAGAKVTSIYYGRQGCACGCRGRYTENPSPARVATALRRMRENVASEGEIELIGGLLYDERILSWEGEQRAIRIYYVEASE